MIILVHSPQKVEGINETVIEISRFGETGCQLFFLLSGFSQALSWSKREQRKWEFYKARFLGIAPPYYFMIVFYFILNGILGKFHCSIGFIQNASLGPVLYNVLFVHGFLVEGHNNVMPGGWYIGVAMFFYVLFPLIVKGVKWFGDRMGKCLVIIPFVVFFLNRFLVISFLDVLLAKLRLTDVIYYQDILFNLPVFLLGIILCYQYNNEYLLLNGKNKLIYSILAVVSAGVAVYDYYVGGIFNRQFSSGVFFYIILALTLGGEKHRKEKKFYKHIMKIGKESYYIYLTHFLFVWYGMPGIFRYLDLISGNKTVKYICILGAMLPLIYFSGRIFSYINYKLMDCFEGFMLGKRSEV